MITVTTNIEYPYKEFTNKEDFKTYLVNKYVPETDPLRQYNFDIMSRYGNCFFNLDFLPPNKGILYHRYHSQEDYLKSVSLRIKQKIHCESVGIKYEYHVKPQLKTLSKQDYKALHTKKLQPLNLKINSMQFLREINLYSEFFSQWGDKKHNVPRYGIPLVNTNGLLHNKPEPACWPLDRWNFIHTNVEDTPDNFISFHNSVFDINQMVNESDFNHPTEILNLPSLQALKNLQPFLYRSCILKFNKGAHFKPHIDTWEDKSPWLRLWGTTHPSNMLLRYKTNNGYVAAKNIESGRIYLHDSSLWHDAISTCDNTYQFFIALDVESYDTIKGLFL